MTAEKKSALQTIEDKKELITEVADKIWEYAELSLQEFKSAALYCEVLLEFPTGWVISANGLRDPGIQQPMS